MPRFLTLADLAEILNVSAAQAYALVRAGDIRAIKVGGRGQWRIEDTELENYIGRMYDVTAQFVADHPLIDPLPGEAGTRVADGSAEPLRLATSDESVTTSRA